MFLHLTTVNGVGPRLAVNILSGIHPDEIRMIILQQEVTRLRSVPGVGKKIAERIILELRDRLKGQKDREADPIAPGPDPGAYSDAFSALINLGYKAAEADRSLKQARKSAGEDASLERLLKEALRLLA
jgi:Holliday junction DNA helicase RuvA